MSNPIEIGEQNSGSKEIAFPLEWPTKDIEIADAEISRAAHAIRLFYHRQLPLLRQIPYLALEANGRGGWRDEYSRAYGGCMMAIHQEGETFGGYSTGSYDMFIELRTGVLIGAESSKRTVIITPYETSDFGGDVTWTIASDREVFIKLAYQDEERRFNPSAEIAYMKEMIKKPYHNEPKELARALENKKRYKERLDKKMAELPVEQVIATLKAQGFKL